jgi:ferredoxin
LSELLAAWTWDGRRVAGPVTVAPGKVQYAWLRRTDDLRLDGFIRPANSIKEFVFPRHEKLYGYRIQDQQIELYDVDSSAAEQLIIAARPCDAASLPILDPLFNWDYRDELYNRHRAQTTIVTLACREHDDHCFCTSVGCGPADERGSDAMLFDLGDGDFEVRLLTDKGRRLFEGRTTSADRTGTAGPGPAATIDLEAVRRFIQGGFDSPVWAAQTLRCLGCGACAFTCPTCHCFDIVDEGNAAGGSRVRNWDACQFGLFTLHASGHNPRTVQGQRQRQRITHKFEIYPEKFGEILCTGCGNCTRNCPVALGVRPVLQAILSVDSSFSAEVS